MTEIIRFPTILVLAATVVVAVGPSPTLGQEVEIVAVDVKAVAKGYVDVCIDVCSRRP